MNSFFARRGVVGALTLALCVLGPPTIVLALAAALVTGCDSDQQAETVPGNPCVGGVMVDGGCQALCDPERCREGSICLDNECRLVCYSHRDCDQATQTCAPPQGPPMGDELLVNLAGKYGVCTDLPHRRNRALATFGDACNDPLRCNWFACSDVEIDGVVFPTPPCDPNACEGQPELCQPDPAVCAPDDPFCLAGKCQGSDLGCLVRLCEPYQCRQPHACLDGRPCDPQACNFQPDRCVLDETACGEDPSCTIGKCEDTEEPCVVTTCEMGECSTLFCTGRDEGDTTAYCSHDCTQDAGCPGGYRCGAMRDPHQICSTCQGGACSHNPERSCSGDEQCQRSGSFYDRHCGETSEDCLAPADFTAGGRQYFEGSQCLMRRGCLRRAPCSPCEDNLDCSLFDNQICIDLATERVCAQFCEHDSDCFGDEVCMMTYSTCSATPTVTCNTAGDCPPIPCTERTCGGTPGGAPCTSSEQCEGQPCIGTCGGWPRVGGSCESSADCGAQRCVSRAVCVPSSGSCRSASIPGGFCEHCVDDTDCGDASMSVTCREVTDGQYACFDESFPDECPGGLDSECPTSPSGAHGECLDEDEGVAPGDSLYHRCYFPFRSSDHRFTCWP